MVQRGMGVRGGIIWAEIYPHGWILFWVYRVEIVVAYTLPFFRDAVNGQLNSIYENKASCAGYSTSQLGVTSARIVMRDINPDHTLG